MEKNRLQIQTYGRVRVYANQTTMFETGAVRESFISPDGIQAIHLSSLLDHMLVLTNRGNVAFMVSVATRHQGERRILANIVYDPVNHNVRVNNNWSIEPFAVNNSMIRDQNLLPESRFLCLELHSTNFHVAGENRVDVKIGVGHFAALIFSFRELLGVQFNGNDYFELLGSEIERLFAINNPEFAAIEGDDAHGNQDPVLEDIVVHQIKVIGDGLNNMVGNEDHNDALKIDDERNPMNEKATPVVLAIGVVNTNGLVVEAYRDQDSVPDDIAIHPIEVIGYRLNNMAGDGDQDGDNANLIKNNDNNDDEALINKSVDNDTNKFAVLEDKQVPHVIDAFNEQIQ